MQGRNRCHLETHRDNNDHVPTPSSTAVPTTRGSAGSNSREADDDSATNTTIQTNADATTITTTTTTGQSEASSTISQFSSFFRERLHLDEELQSDNQSTNYEQADYEVPLRGERSSHTPNSSVYGSSSKESHPFFDGRFIEVDGMIDLDPEWIEKQSRAKEQRRLRRRRGAWGRNAATTATRAKSA